MTAPLIVRSAEDMHADRQELVLMLHDFSFQTPDELLAGLTKSNSSQSAMPKSGMGNKAIVMPSSMPRFLIAAEAVGMRIHFVVDTHVHADHLSAGRQLAKAAGAEYVLAAHADVSFPFRGACDEEILPLGNVVATVLHTPGVPVGNQIRTYWWCNPPRIGVGRTRPKV